jgi:hypothetical protein
MDARSSRREIGSPLSPIARRTSSAQDARKVLATVGDVAVTTADLARFRRIRELTLGVVDDRRLLDDLCDRVLLELAAREAGLEPGQVDVEQAALRKRLLIEATTGAPPSDARPFRRFEGPSAVGRFPSMPSARTRPFVETLLVQASLDQRALEVEAAADLRASWFQRRALGSDCAGNRACQRRDELLERLRVRWPVEKLSQ